MRFDVEHMETEMAWEKMVETDKIKDIDGFRNVCYLMRLIRKVNDTLRRPSSHTPSKPQWT